MNAIAISEFSQRLSWTLVNSLWQFGLIGLLLALLLRTLRGRSPHVRYAGTMLALAAMLVVPAVTLCLVSPDMGTAESQATAQLPGKVERGAPPVGLIQVEVSPSPLNPLEASSPGEASADRSVRVSEAAPTGVDFCDRFVASINVFIRHHIHLILGFWILGMIVLSVRPLIGWRASRALRLTGRSSLPGEIASTTRRVADRLGINRAIEVAQSSLVEVPTVVGWLKPLVLLPAGAISGLSTAGLEAVIAHELAHVRRHDYLVNLLQMLMETVFFYHPVTWWVSQRMRIEREECCDRIAANLTGDRVGYARVLMWLEETRTRAEPTTLAMSAGGGSLLSRIRRVVARPEETSRFGPLAMILMLTLVCGVITAFVWTSNESRAEDQKEQPNEASLAKLPDGLSVELVAVLPHQADASKGWQLDGRPLDSSLTLPKNGRTLDDQNEPTIDYVFHFAGLKRDQHPTYRTDGLVTWRHPGDDRMARIETKPDPSRTTATLQVGIPDADWGPWTKVNPSGEILAPAEIPPRLENAHETMRVHDVVSRGDRTMLRWAWEQNDKDIAAFEVRAVDKAGKDYQVRGRTLWTDERGIDRNAEIFDLPIKDVDHIEYRLRPYRHWATFQNVSLRPGKRSKPQTVVETFDVSERDNLAADDAAQALGEAVHRQLTAIDRLPNFSVSTQTFTSYYGNPDGVIGLKDERSLEHLKTALKERDFDRSLSTADQMWAWNDREVVTTRRNVYQYEGKPYDQASSRTWDGKQGWYYDSTSVAFGRYRTFAETFKHHYFKPLQFLHPGDHRFSWVKADEYPNAFVGSTIPVQYANYQSLPDEAFGGESCSVIRSIPRQEQFWISKTSGRLVGCLAFIAQGRFTRMHEMESTIQMAGQKFDSDEEFRRWLDESATPEQRYQLKCEFWYLHRHNQHPKELIEFSDYREVAPGVELPMTEWWSTWMHEGKRYKYNINHTIVRKVDVDVELQPLVAAALPKKGDKIHDWRHITHVEYPYDPEMPELEIHAMVDKAQAERLESKRMVENLLKPLKAMIGRPAPKLSGDWIGESEPDSADSSGPTLLHFWATWCGPCKNDIPQLNRMANAGWNVVGVHAPGTEPDEIESEMEASGIGYTVLLGEESKGSGLSPDLISGYPVAMFPICVLIDKEGKIEAVGQLSDVLSRK